jgi:plastocyanin
MTFRWFICFSLLALVSRAATVEGRFQVVDSRLASVVKKKDYSGVVAWLEPATGKASLPAGAQHTILQKGKRFIPHISVITVGTTVHLPNLDPIFHNAFSNFAGQPFDTGLYPPGGTQKVRFARPGVVRVFCNIHASMSAVIVVLETPYFAVSGLDGAFRIGDVPPGEYTLKVWHERSAEAKLKTLERRLAVPPAGLALPLLTVSELGYVALPHKNKFGKDYGPEPVPAVPYGPR